MRFPAEILAQSSSSDLVVLLEKSSEIYQQMCLISLTPFQVVFKRTPLKIIQVFMCRFPRMRSKNIPQIPSGISKNCPSIYSGIQFFQEFSQNFLENATEIIPELPICISLEMPPENRSDILQIFGNFIWDSLNYLYIKHFSNTFRTCCINHSQFLMKVVHIFFYEFLHKFIE